jgi:hypothetical protein
MEAGEPGSADAAKISLTQCMTGLVCGRLGRSGDDQDGLAWSCRPLSHERVSPMEPTATAGPSPVRQEVMHSSSALLRY